ncbi:uncharacterized protein EV420DRAFT_1616996 [Desarmillaria tabescens]|uniref:DUF455-domain-containing protein n=1 Tax=Armillaria tabescens TaxID=1929756 RepID=A0AA39NMJ0_ARMTA|nr:uncharacterized protein EV420DRAFT_1616996 [Desarmillaria tabescens]KAK0468392.1 hypothetical protein EV420DRAFT_1616996 [Desarmillaria tabescens]
MNDHRIAPFRHLLSHLRFLMTIRSQEGIYRGLILFRLSPSVPAIRPNERPTDKENLKAMYKQIYVMESTCPHLGADMSHADIEEYDSGVVAVSKILHRYDFNLETGKSETGLHTCTYDVKVDVNPLDGLDTVYVETPKVGTNWRLVELRPVSEEFADPPPLKDATSLPVRTSTVESVEEPIVPTTNAPTTLMQWAVLILNTSNPTLKVQRTRHAVHLFRTGKLTSIGHKSPNAPRPPDTPLREAQYERNTVEPVKMKNRKSRAVMLHALANIEQWAWDIMARFGPMHPDLPPAFFSDFTKMALDESKHFTLLTSRLAATSPTTPYGSLPVHAALWESATITANSFRARLAIIHLVHEARGLDVNPGTIERFRKAGDDESVKAMEVIHADEVTHVTAGHRWFTWICENDGNVDPIKTFREEVRKGWRGDIKGPFNADDREKAGLSREFYENLRGEMDNQPSRKPIAPESVEGMTDSLAAVHVQYDSSNKK